MKKFEDYQISKEIIKSLDIMKFNEPTEVQKKAIPQIMEGSNVIIKSQTGSGKTAAFGIPLCEKINWEEFAPQALVLVPTRELAIQVSEDLFNIGRFKIIKVLPVYGKSPITHQVKNLKQKTHIVVGTPGRIIDLIDRDALDLSNIKYLVLDEADEMLNMGFINDIETILNKIPNKVQSILLSATMPDKIKILANKYIKKAVEVTSEEKKNIKDMIDQEVYKVIENEKLSLLKDVTILENPDSCIIFCNTKQKVDDIYESLTKSSYPIQKIHGGMEQYDRIQVMKEFKMGNFRYLVATDVAARGLDIESISLIINYDIPTDSESYVHRIGRTGRIGKKGKAITFRTPYENRFLSDIEELINSKITEKEIPNKSEIGQLRADFNEKIYTLSEQKISKTDHLSKEILKLHINAGKKTKMRAIDIVGTICNIEGLKKEDIGIIEIRDISTFVEILNDKGEIVYKALQEMPIKGRPRRVSKMDE